MGGSAARFRNTQRAQCRLHASQRYLPFSNSTDQHHRLSCSVPAAVTRGLSLRCGPQLKIGLVRNATSPPGPALLYRVDWPVQPGPPYRPAARAVKAGDSDAAGAGDVVVMVGTRDSDAHATRRVDRMPNPWPVTRIVGRTRSPSDASPIRNSDSVPGKLELRARL